MEKIVYFDHAATTKISKAAWDSMSPYLMNEYGNPSASYAMGRSAKRAVEEARHSIAKSIGALPEEVYFTCSGTESDNWAVKCIAELEKSKGNHIITTVEEHAAILESLKSLEQKGYDITYLDVDSYGQISLDKLESCIRKETILITIMTANNEIGTILPISKIGQIASEHKVLFHTDAVQAVGHIPIQVKEMKVDMLSFSGHKLGGAKGAGVLFIKKGLRLPPFLHGGGQEGGIRSGTENVAAIVSMAAALSEKQTYIPLDKVKKMRDRLIHEVLKISNAYLTGDPVERLPGLASFVFEGIEGEMLLILLDQCGICASSGSACSSKTRKPSHVLLATGWSPAMARGSLRFSLSEENTEEEIDYVLEKLTEIINRLRRMF